MKISELQKILSRSLETYSDVEVKLEVSDVLKFDDLFIVELEGANGKVKCLVAIDSWGVKHE